MPGPGLVKGGLLALAASALALFSGIQSLREIWRARSPDAAQRLPFEAQAPLLKLSAGLFSRETALTREEVFPLARRALRDNPLNPVALRMMALASDPNSTSRESIGYARLAERLSRRDLFVQLILIEEAVREDNVPAALRRYDQALRTNPESSELLFPVLSDALSVPEIRKGLGSYYVVGAPWFETFISYTAQKSKAAAIVDLMFEAGPKKNSALLGTVAPVLLTRLIEQHEYVRADRLLAMLPGGDRRLLERAEWTAGSIDSRFGAFAWQSWSNETVSAGFETTANRETPEFHLYVRPGVEAMVLSKVLALKPGPYRIMLARTVDVSDPGARAWWKAKCLDAMGGAVFWESVDILQLKADEAIAGPKVPAACHYLELELWAQGGQGQDGLDAQIHEFGMKPE